ncbi:sericin 1-like [Haliotis cracherodii]|uniref:sericin 1-like n=1 Tax=Haliotis cracherodii TaxID=6455 RepID=UPI0039ECCA98
MKAVYATLVTALYAAVVLADTNINSYGGGGSDKFRGVFQESSHAQNQAKSTKALKDHDSFGGARDRFFQDGNKYNGHASGFGQDNAKASAHGNKAEQNFAKQDAKYDEIARQIADASKVTGHQTASEGKYDNVDNNRARGYNSAAAKKNAYNRGKVFNDNISYGFDKKFNQDLSEKGGFEEESGHTSHKLDELQDKEKARKLLRGDHSAANARQDAQHALKESKFNQNAAQRQAAHGKYGKNDKKLDKAGTTNDAQAILYDRKDSKFSEEDKGQQKAVNNANQFAKKDNLFGRQAAASHAGARGHADKKYYGAHGNDGHGSVGVGGHGVDINGVHGEGTGGSNDHQYGEHQDQVDQGKEHLAQKAGTSDAALKQFDQSKKKQDFAQIKSLKNERNGKFAQGVHNAENNGFSDKDSHASKAASGDDRKYADAAAQSNAKAAKHDLDEELFDKENLKRKQHDQSENFKKLKRFYHDKKSGGNNFERLKYNRKRVENEFGNTQAAQKEQQGQFDNAHKSAKHNAASRKDNYQDAKKASRGFSLNKANRDSAAKSNINAHTFDKAAQQAHGNKKDIAESDFKNQKDSLQQKQQKLHDNTIGAFGVSADGYKNAKAQEKQSSGSVLGGTGLNVGFGIGSSAAYRDDKNGVLGNIASGAHDNDFHGNVVTGANRNEVHGVSGAVNGVHDSNNIHQGDVVHGSNNIHQGDDIHGSNNIHQGDDVHGSNNFHQGGNSYRNGNSNNAGSYGSTGSQHFGGKRRVGNLDNHGQSGYGNNHANSFGSSLFGHGTGSFGNGLFGSFGSFGHGSGRGNSNFGRSYASKSGERTSVPRSGGLFSSSFGSSFNKPKPFRSSFGSKPQFGFGLGSKGPLF